MIYSFCSIHLTWYSNLVIYVKRNVELENKHRKAAHARIPSDPNGWQQMRENYEAIVLEDHAFSELGYSSSTGCSDSQYFEELYNYYTTEKAWHLCDPDAEKVFKTLRNAVSAEVEAEKPNPTIFIKACELLGVKPEDAVHVGDDCRNDIWGARDAGCDAWLWGSDVHSFKEVAQRIGVWV
ncbi:Glyceraldehyde 3-phosphate phosphatase [Camellia lanceoleosa]|uniref:Glyceraldehyde 3-phosphate phosphatase n=1 Tax=Camellia lanceoleosa TaxID=1840588 RepID=A0ACC0FS42_9ERIC|nr:Glyceraldehyde 3-phosphate phosphatase [Camellia lanceoleosa]